jgi:hypothetical protein
LRKLAAILAFVLACFAFAFPAAGQTIIVDISHPTNRFVPKETLGAGVDRIGVEAIDKDLLQPTLEKTLASGWQPGPHVMIITPHNEDLAKFNRDGSKGQIYVSHLPGHSELYMIIPFKDLPQQ